MGKRVGLAVVLVLLLAAPALGGDASSRKESIDSRIARLHEQIAAAQSRETTLNGQIADVSRRIQGLQAQVGDVSARLVTLERDLALHREKLARLTELYRVQTHRYEFARRQYRQALFRFARRLVTIYEADEADSLDVVVSAKSLTDVLEQIDYTREINRADRRIARAVRKAKEEARLARERTKHVRAIVAAETRTVAVRTQQVRSVRDRLLTSRRELVAARGSKRESLDRIRASEREFVAEAQALEQASAQLAAQIQAAQASVPPGSSSSSDSTTSASGLIWPVSGPVVSGFGMRWGRMHTGIDIAAGSGTPIHASASGTVIYSGWMGGYGNLVVIDHGGGLATAYAHQSSIAAGNGQRVSQGQVIGYVGCTGHCFGPHLHFEVRVNGAPVDPLGYL